MDIAEEIVDKMISEPYFEILIIDEKGNQSFATKIFEEILEQFRILEDELDRNILNKVIRLPSPHKRIVLKNYSQLRFAKDKYDVCGLCNLKLIYRPKDIIDKELEWNSKLDGKDYGFVESIIYD